MRNENIEHYLVLIHVFEICRFTFLVNDSSIFRKDDLRLKLSESDCLSSEGFLSICLRCGIVEGLQVVPIKRSDLAHLDSTG
jgi:hypothetical protein